MRRKNHDDVLLEADSLFRDAASKHLYFFTRYTYLDYTAKWYHKEICSALDDLERGVISRLMVFVPPQHGKSELVSRRFPAYCLGRNPDVRVAACSYSSDLAQQFNRAVQRIIDSDEYRNVFPATQLNGKNVVSESRGAYIRNSDSFEVVGRLGQYHSVGVMGPLTGKSVDIGIIDDPVKDQLEAASETFRNRLWEWYNDVFCTRLHNASRVLLTMTRWHEDDLAGRILAAEGDKWRVIKYPAIREDMGDDTDPREIGDALWPERHNAESIIEKKKKSERTYASLYQQRPAPAEGGLFKRSWWRFWEELPEMDRVIVSWDCTFKETGSSYVVGQVWGKSGADAYLIDMVRGKWDFPDTVRHVRAVHDRHPYARETLIEEKANGGAIIQMLRREIPGLIPVVPNETKKARASAVTYVIESGNVYLPKRDMVAWVDDAIYELSVFPNGVNDDIVDSLTQALERMYGRVSAKASMVAI
jgi:predicted phage terminase large subunit-like protein